jgi:hypothetical protein
VALELYSEPTFGRIKFQKLIYLCEHIGKLNTQAGRAISRIPMPSFLSCRICFNCSIVIGFCAIALLYFLRAKDIKKHRTIIAVKRWVNIPELKLLTNFILTQGGSTCRNGTNFRNQNKIIFW